MPTLKFIEASGQTHVVEAVVGQSVMEAATGHLVPGIVGECGGCCACATCHVYVEEPWCGQLEPPDEMERGMLDGTPGVTARSRLSCQIKVSAALDGLVLRIPAAS